MKEFTDRQIDDILKLKYGKIVTSDKNVAYVSNASLGKLFKVSANKIRQICKERFEKER